MRESTAVLLGGAPVCLFLWIMSATAPAAQPDPIEVQDHLRQACALVWEDGKPGAIDRCVGRAMDALGTNERLRARELQRRLVRCETELGKLKEKENGNTSE